ncbi:MAG: hypothetical protein R3346_02530 [Candidatus Spechtbacterales bacterium]|nr:hypothetical protein [Candidatus Spechtbacterales bacterium]
MGNKEERNERILLDIVEEYIRTAEPVSSGYMLKKHKYGLSSATLRNIMSDLDEGGFLYQPHTSAGRVPTQKAYRFYVDKVALGSRKPLDTQKRKENEMRAIQRDIKKAMRKSPEDAGRVLSQYLAEMTNSLAFAGFVNINRFYREGLLHLLDEPEFLTAENIRHLVEYADSLENRLERLYRSIEDDIKVFIGEETEEETSDFSLMAFTSELPTRDKAVFGILGPMRMHYTENLHLLNEIKKLFDEL